MTSVLVVRGRNIKNATGHNMRKLDYKKVKRMVNVVLNENLVVEPPVRVEEITRNYGLHIRQTDFVAKGFHQVAGFLDLEQKTIYLNQTDADSRKAFTIAKILGYWLLHQNEILANPDKYTVIQYKPLGRQANKDLIEREANFFASQLLIPDSMVENFFDQLQDLKKITRIFGVSEDVISYRLKEQYGF